MPRLLLSPEEQAEYDDYRAEQEALNLEYRELELQDAADYIYEVPERKSITPCDVKYLYDEPF